MTHDTKLLDKIRAILRKAEEGTNPSEAERDTAVRMANRLLLKHGLSMQDIGTIEGDTTPAGRAHEHGQVHTTTSDQDRWQGNLLYRIAPVYFCHVYYVPGRHSQRWYILGRGDYAEAVRAMFTWIVPQIEREFGVAASKMTQHRRYARRYAEHACEDMDTFDELTEEELAERGSEHWARTVDDIGLDAALREIQVLIGCNRLNAERTKNKIVKGDIAPASPENLGVWRRSFFHAANLRIKNRLWDMMKDETKDLGEPGMALVKNERDDLMRYVDSLDLNLHSVNSGRQHDEEGAALGIEAADRADLSPHNKVSSINRNQLGA